MTISTRDLHVELQPDEVLVKMIAAPINPSDISFIQGGYAIKKPLPAIPGFEATGEVVDTGSNAMHFKNQRISCFTQKMSWGTYSEFFVADAKDCIPILKNLPEKQAACFSINPFTAYGLMEEIKQKRQRSVILNAAGSQVAGLLRQMARKEGIKVINIIRKPELKKLLEEEGEEWILIQEQENFDKELTIIAKKLNAHLALDAVGGDMTGTLLNCLPDKSTVLVYGGLSGKPLGNANPLQVIFHKKVLKGWDLNHWLAIQGKDRFDSISEKLQRMIIDGNLSTKIQNEYTLEDYEKALFQYIKKMSLGKILLRP